MLFVKLADHRIHYYKKKNVYLSFCVIIVVRDTSSLVSRLVFKLKLANVQQHVRKQPKTDCVFFFALGYFPFCCLGVDQYTFYLNKRIRAWKIIFKIKSIHIYKSIFWLQMNKYGKFCSNFLFYNGINRRILSRFQHTS
jgi:hypothetical protein